MTLPGCTLRDATLQDIAAINDIYNHFVRHSSCTYQEIEETIDARKEWFHHHDTAHPIIVAENENGVVGWGSLSKFHTRSAYRFTVENSVYVDHLHHKQGIGSALLAELIARATSAGHHAIIAGIDSEQAGSIALHAKFGFEHVARLKQVGYKFNRWLDVVYMERFL